MHTTYGVDSLSWWFKGRSTLETHGLHTSIPAWSALGELRQAPSVRRTRVHTFVCLLPNTEYQGCGLRHMRKPNYKYCLDLSFREWFELSVGYDTGVVHQRSPHAIGVLLYSKQSFDKSPCKMTNNCGIGPKHEVHRISRFVCYRLTSDRC
jgi:hypothetical protein